MAQPRPPLSQRESVFSDVLHLEQEVLLLWLALGFIYCCVAHVRYVVIEHIIIGYLRLSLVNIRCPIKRNFQTSVVCLIINITLVRRMELPFMPLTLFLSLSGEPPVPWERWHESFLTYITQLARLPQFPFLCIMGIKLSSHLHFKSLTKAQNIWVLTWSAPTATSLSWTM